jgi:hypothetical protein
MGGEKILALFHGVRFFHLSQVEGVYDQTMDLLGPSE